MTGIDREKILITVHAKTHVPGTGSFHLLMAVALWGGGRAGFL